jgi:hypothetical protein
MAVEFFQARYTRERIGNANGSRNGSFVHVLFLNLSSFQIPPRVTTVDVHLENAFPGAVDRLKIRWLQGVQAAGILHLVELNRMPMVSLVCFFEFPALICRAAMC